MNKTNGNKYVAINTIGSYISQLLHKNEYNNALNTYSECLQTILNAILLKTKCPQINFAITNLIDNETNIHNIIVYIIQMLKEKDIFRHVNLPTSDDASAIKNISQITNVDQIYDFIKSKHKWLYFNCNFKHFLAKIIEINIHNIASYQMDKDSIFNWKNIYEEIINNYHLNGNNLYLINSIWYQELRLIHFLYNLINQKLLHVFEEENEENEKRKTYHYANLTQQIDNVEKELKRYQIENNNLIAKNSELGKLISEMEIKITQNVNSNNLEMEQQTTKDLMTRYEEEIQILKRAINERDETLANQQREAAKQKNAMETDLQLQNEELKRSFEEQIKNLEGQNSNLQNENIIIKKQLSDLQNEKHQENIAIQKQLSDLQNEKSQLDKENKTIKMQLSDISSKYADLQTQYDETKTAFNNAVYKFSKVSNVAENSEAIKTINENHAMNLEKINKQHNAFLEQCQKDSIERLNAYNYLLQQLEQSFRRLTLFCDEKVKSEETMTEETMTEEKSTLNIILDTMRRINSMIDKVILKFNNEKESFTSCKEKINSMERSISNVIDILNNDEKEKININLMDNLLKSAQNLRDMYLEGREENARILSTKIEGQNIIKIKIKDINNILDKYLKEEEKEDIPIILQLNNLSEKITKIMEMLSVKDQLTSSNINKIIEIVNQQADEEADEVVVIKEEYSHNDENSRMLSTIKNFILNLKLELKRMKKMLAKTQDVLNKHELKIKIEKEKENYELMEITQDIDEQLIELFNEFEKQISEKNNIMEIVLNYCKEYFKEILEISYGTELKFLKQQQSYDNQEFFETAVKHVQKIKDDIKARLEDIKQKEISLSNMITTVESMNITEKVPITIDSDDEDL